MVKRIYFTLIFGLLTGALLLSACGPAATAAPAQTEAAPTTAVSAPTTPPATEVPPTAVPTEVSKVGGTLVYAAGQEPDTLDMHKTALGASYNIMYFMGGALLSIRDGQFGPFLAESWTISEDGTSITFKLKQGVTFHDGTPLTAQDWVYTYLRAVDPATASPAAGPTLGALTAAEALDDYTLKLTWATANAAVFSGLADRGYLQPLSQEAVERLGDDYGRNPVGVGAFMFKEWVTGDHVTLVRNPNYTWGPASDDAPGAYNFDEIKFPVIPEYSTRLAGFEAGEIDVTDILPQDVDRISALDTAQVFSYVGGGLNSYITFNVSKAPWNDINVRKAIYMAIDRQAMLDLVVQGKGEVMYGPLSSTTIGYVNVDDKAWPNDLAAANALLDEAGYTAGADGVRAKDGVRLSYPFYFFAGDPLVEKTATIVQDQLKQIGIELTLQSSEIGTIFGEMVAGNYDIMLSGVGYNEADILYLLLHSSQVGALNYQFTSDPELDALLEAERSTLDPAARLEALKTLQEYIVENVIFVPLFAANNYLGVSSRVHDVSLNANAFQFDFSASYIVP
jgi:peptide/nickel transport system substrate-binding protein